MNKPFTSRLCCNSGLNYGKPDSPAKNVGHGMKAITDPSITSQERKAHMMYHQKQRMMKKEGDKK